MSFYRLLCASFILLLSLSSLSAMVFLNSRDIEVERAGVAALTRTNSMMLPNIRELKENTLSLDLRRAHADMLADSINSALMSFKVLQEKLRASFGLPIQKAETNVKLQFIIRTTPYNPKWRIGDGDYEVQKQALLDDYLTQHQVKGVFVDSSRPHKELAKLTEVISLWIHFFKHREVALTMYEIYRTIPVSKVLAGMVSNSFPALDEEDKVRSYLKNFIETVARGHFLELKYLSILASRKGALDWDCQTSMMEFISQRAEVEQVIAVKTAMKCCEDNSLPSPIIYQIITQWMPVLCRYERFMEFACDVAEQYVDFGSQLYYSSLHNSFMPIPAKIERTVKEENITRKQGKQKSKQKKSAKKKKQQVKGQPNKTTGMQKIEDENHITTVSRDAVIEEETNYSDSESDHSFALKSDVSQESATAEVKPTPLSVPAKLEDLIEGEQEEGWVAVKKERHAAKASRMEIQSTTKKEEVRGAATTKALFLDKQESNRLAPPPLDSLEHYPRLPKVVRMDPHASKE